MRDCIHLVWNDGPPRERLVEHLWEKIDWYIDGNGMMLIRSLVISIMVWFHIGLWIMIMEAIEILLRALMIEIMN